MVDLEIELVHKLQLLYILMNSHYQQLEVTPIFMCTILKELRFLQGHKEHYMVHPHKQVL